jgi:gluconate 2-dehydrogenase subunit 3-like protein
VVKNLTMAASATSILSVIPLKAAQHVHKLVAQEKTARSGAGYRPKFFEPHQWQTLKKLCELIIPPDEKSGGALEANAPEFIDLLTSENPEFKIQLSGGLRWLDSYCRNLYLQPFLNCSPEQQKATLRLLAYRKNSTAQISQGISFFSLLRNLTVDGFYTSQIGIKDVGYVGNDVMGEFPGCPPFPEG